MSNLKQITLWVIVSLLLISIVPISPAPVQAQADTTPVVLWMEGDYWRYYPSTETLEQITTWGWNQFPVISPGNTKIAYSSTATVAVDYINSGNPGVGSLPSNIWILDIVTGDGVRVADQVSGATMTGGGTLITRSAPAWSPDGTYLAWTELKMPGFSFYLAIYNTLAGTTQSLPITGHVYGDAGSISPPLPVKWGRGGIAVQDYILAQATGIGTYQYQIFEPNGTSLGTFTPNAGSAKLVDFTWIEDGDLDYLGVLFDDGTWHLLNPKSGMETVYTGTMELYNPQFPNRHRLQVTYQGTQNSIFTAHVTSPNTASTVLPYSNGDLDKYSISPTGNTVVYTVFGINQGSYIWSDGVLQKIITGANFATNVVWGYSEWRLGEGSALGTPISQVVQPPIACLTELPSRLIIGRSAHVLPGGSNNMRDAANVNANLLLQIPEGANMTVLDGPTCVNNLAWWQVNYNGTIGWTVEGSGIDYWLSPGLNTTIAPNLQGAVLEVTQSGGVVTARDGLSRAANEVETLLWGDRVLWTGVMTSNQTLNWFHVNLGNGQNAYIEDTGAFTVEDPGYQTPGIFVGGTVSVTANGAGMHLRTGTSTYSAEVATLQQGQTMTVTGGPFYSEYYIWWQYQLTNGATGYAVDVASWLNPQ